MLLKIVYLLVRRILGLAILAFRKDLAKDAELLVFRHENTVLGGHAGRIRFEPADRAWFAVLAQLVPRGRWAGIFPVDAGDAAGLAPQAGRPEVRHEQRAHARAPASSPQHRPSRHPPGRRIHYGVTRIHGELTKLGVRIPPSTVYEILRAAGIGPAPRRPVRPGGSS